MQGNKNMETSQLETRTRLYSYEAEIRKDQEAVVTGVLDKDSDLAYLKKNPDLAFHVRTGCIDGIRQGIADFMKRKGITDMRDVFEGDNSSEYYHSDQKYTILEERLTSDPVLRTQLCDTKEDSVDECKYIAEIMGCAYVNEILLKEIRVFGTRPSVEVELNYINMPDE